MEFKTLSEKTAYLKGLIKGLKSDDEVIALISDILVEMSHEIEGTKADIDELTEVVDALDEDLSDMEKEFYDDDSDDDDYLYDCDDENDDDELFDDNIYEVTCPTCGDVIALNEAMLEEGSINCPGCGEALEFDIEEFEDNDEDEE